MKNCEYLPPPSESNHDHQKVFSLQRVEDDTKLILETRMQANTDHSLTFGARVLFTLLLDLSLNPFLYQSRGSVTVSVEKLSTLLGAGEASIGEWKKMLINRRYIWIKAHYMPNTWPMHTFSITALVSPDQRLLGKVTGDGLWGNGHRRPNLLPEGSMDQKLIHGETGPKEPNVPETEEISTPGPENHGFSGSETDPGRIENRSGEDQKVIRAGSDSDPGRIRKHGLAGSENRGCPDQKTGVIRESLDRVKGPKDRLGGTPAPKATPEEQLEEQLQAWRQSLNGSFPGKIEKLLTRLIRERDNESAPNVRQFVGRKIKILQELLDGPKPKPEPAAQPARPTAKVVKELTADALLATARDALLLGEQYLTKGQRAALVKAGELKP